MNNITILIIINYYIFYISYNNVATCTLVTYSNIML